MTDFAPTSVILYVTDVEASTTFYRQALNKEPIETFDDFAVLASPRTSPSESRPATRSTPPPPAHPAASNYP
ncbi:MULTISPECIES: VOC family protein [Corynebacterium]|uniref:VOC family protein n=1 Tax=Corynebacterium TaxID=1716 RepID=UPI00196A36DF|nr:MULTISPECIES: VOC family protein [Corynebacterium]